MRREHDELDFANWIDRFFRQHVEVATKAKKTVLFLIDMDGFKEINDTLGHAVGDDVLVEIGSRLSSHFSHRAEVARLGGDEFCILFKDAMSVEAATAIAQSIYDLLTTRYALTEVEATLGTSIGYAICPDRATNEEDLLARRYSDVPCQKTSTPIRALRSRDDGAISKAASSTKSSRKL